MITRLCRRVHFAALTCICVCLIRSAEPVQAQDAPKTTFRAAVTLVPITAVVRDSRNRLVRNLRRDDFQILEQGQLRPIVDFGATDTAPVSVAFLFDTSGSMRLATNLEKGKRFVDQVLSQMENASDEAALFTFDRALRHEVAFTGERDRIHAALDGLSPWGLTSLYDAIAATANQLADRPTQRRAVVVITDGIDTSSSLAPQQVSALASAIDVPVYVVAVAATPQRPGDSLASLPEETNDGLSNLAFWTGGDLLYLRGPEQAAAVTDALLAAMRLQYFLAIESSTAAGWYRLEVRTKRKNLMVRARAGYFAGQPSGTSNHQPTTR
jgi:Ca-activated chloride channel family protein